MSRRTIARAVGTPLVAAMTLGAGAASVRAAASAETQMYAVYEGQDTERSLWQLHARAVIASQIASGQKTQQ